VKLYISLLAEGSPEIGASVGKRYLAECGWELPLSVSLFKRTVERYWVYSSVPLCALSPVPVVAVCGVSRTLGARGASGRGGRGEQTAEARAAEMRRPTGPGVTGRGAGALNIPPNARLTSNAASYVDAASGNALS
jgi:hypothetical protein